MNKYLNRFDVVVGGREVSLYLFDIQVQIGRWQYRSGVQVLGLWYGQEAVWSIDKGTLFILSHTVYWQELKIWDWMRSSGKRCHF